MTRKTLYRVASGDPAVSLGVYARVLQALRLENDLASIGLGDALGRKLQDASLEPKRSAPRKSKQVEPAAEGKRPPAAKKSKDKP